MVVRLLNPAVSARIAQPGMIAGSTSRIWLGSPIPIFIAWHFPSAVCEFNAVDPRRDHDRTGYGGCRSAEKVGSRAHLDQVSCSDGIPGGRSVRSLDAVTALCVGRTEQSAGRLDS